MRKYSYFICNQAHPALFMRNTSWHVPFKLDIGQMQKAGKLLEGEHDFKSFCVSVSAKNKPTCRNVRKIEILNYDIYGDNIIEIQVWGNAFLHSMVRTIVGTLIKVGRNLREPEWVLDVLEAKDRQTAGECAPAAGLVFMDVVYPEGIINKK